MIIKKTIKEGIPWLIQTIHPNCIALHVSKQQVHFAKVGFLALVLKKKTATEPKPKHNLDAKSLLT